MQALAKGARMHTRRLGQQGLEVSALGLGCMGMTFAYGEPNNEESLRVLHRAMELGINFWDTAQAYGPFTNEELVGRALRDFSRDRVVIATKFANRFTPTGESLGLDGSAKHVRESIEG